MKAVNYIFMILLILTITAVSVSANTMTITPEKQKQGGSVELKYSIKKGEMPDKAKFVLYAFSNKFTSAKVYEYAGLITPEKSEISATISLPQEIEYGIFTIQSYHHNVLTTERNFGEYYDIFIIGESGKEIINSNMLAAVTYMGGSDIDREADFSKAKSYLKKELELYPDNLQAKIGLTSLLLDTRKINQSEFQSEMKKHLNSKIDMHDERLVTAVVRALKTLNMKEQARKMTSDFIANYPKSGLAEEEVLNKLSAAESLKQFAGTASEFMREFPNSTRKSEVSNAIVKAFLQNSDLWGLGKFTADANIESPDLYLATAQTMLRDSKIMPKLSKSARLDSAISLYTMALDIQKDNYRLAMVNKPEHITNMTTWDYQEGEKTKMAYFYESGGDMFMLRDTAEALGYYEKALNFIGEAPNTELYRKIYNIYAAKQDCKKAYTTISKAVENSAFFTDVEKLFIEAYTLCVNDSEENATDEYQKLLTVAREKRLTNLKQMEVNHPINAAYLKNMDGRIIEFEDFLGKTTILFFQSSWCGPCQATIPASDELYKFYQAEAEVNIASVGVWEQDDNRKEILKNYKKEYEIEYPLLYDETDIIMRSLSLAGLPATVILDKEGKVRFKIKGFTNTEDYIRQITDMVDYLNN
jgi:thiol-disulfide isomerase/thioredoxin